jgi:hypothetical protein
LVVKVSHCEGRELDWIIFGFKGGDITLKLVKLNDEELLGGNKFNF